MTRAAATPRQDVRMDGVAYFRTSAEGGVRRVLPTGRYSYCVLVRRGDLTLEVNYPKAMTLTLEPGDIVAISGLAEHAFSPPAASAETATFHAGSMAEPAGIESDLIIGIVPNESLALGSLIIGPILIRSSEHPDLFRQVWRAAEMLEEEYRSPPSLDRDLVVRRLAELMMIAMTRRIVRAQAAEGVTRGGAGAERQIVNALDAFFQAPAQHWDLPSLARVAGMSRTRFAATFKAVTGETPALVLSRLRLGAVAHRLANENLSVEAAAEASGYGSAAAFVRAFSRVHGETPARWRRRATRRGDLSQNESADEA